MATRTQLGNLVHSVLEGLKDPSNFPEGVTSITVGAETYTLPQLRKLVAEHEALWATPEELDAKYHAAVHLRDFSSPHVKDFMENLVHGIRATLGARSPNLHKFGLEPKRDRRALTSEEAAAAAAKARATRIANGYSEPPAAPEKPAA
jgi:hypothetical protein